MAEESAGEGVVEATWDTAKAHPYLIGGAVAVAVLLIWYFGRKAPAATPPAFSFSYGPSDAQVRAGTALQIAQQADQTQLGMAQIDADTNMKYFDYLATNSANSLAALRDTNANTTQQLGISTNAQIAINSNDNARIVQGNNIMAAINQQNNITAYHGQDLAYQEFTQAGQYDWAKALLDHGYFPGSTS